MREDFLYDSDDKNQRGKGVDRVGTKKDGVSLEWKSNHHQICFAEIGRYTLKVIFWRTNYSAEIEVLGETFYLCDKKFYNRIDAQKFIEKRFKEIMLEGFKLSKKIK